MRQREPEEECRHGKQPRRAGECGRAACVHHDERGEREEHERIRHVKERLAEPEEEVETEHRDHAPAVQEVVLHGGGEDIGE